jgi:hypothetical protein
LEADHSTSNRMDVSRVDRDSLNDRSALLASDR